jgi:hypothetical protein
MKLFLLAGLNESAELAILFCEFDAGFGKRGFFVNPRSLYLNSSWAPATGDVRYGA